jgi:hypothetical protein
MKTWYARLFSGLMNAMIVFTIVNAPIVFNYPVGDVFSGVVYAQDEGDITDSGDTTGENTNEDCEEDNTEKEGTYLYKPGCEFQNDVSTVDSLDPGILDNIMTALVAMVMLTMVFYKPTERNNSDCPTNIGHYSIRAAQIAALIYIISEFATNAQYREAAKEAADYNFNPSEKTDDITQTNEQIQAFDALHDIYSNMKETTEAKLGFAILLEAGYLVAEGIEIGNIVSCKAQCTSTRTSASTALQSATKTMATTSATLLGAEALWSNGVAGKTAIAACGTAYTGAAEAVYAFYEQHVVRIEGESAAEALEAEAEEAANHAEAVAEIAILFGGSLISNPAQYVQDEIEEYTKLAEELTVMTANTAEARTLQGTAQTLGATMKTSYGTCTSALVADEATCIAQCGPAAAACAAGCTAWLAAAESMASTTYASMEGAQQAAEAALEVPTLCCGSKAMQGTPPNLRISIPTVPGVFFNKQDIQVVKILGSDAGEISPETQMKDLIKRVVDDGKNYQKEEGLISLFHAPKDNQKITKLFSEYEKQEAIKKLEQYLQVDENYDRMVAGLKMGSIKDMLEKIVYNSLYEQMMQEMLEQKFDGPVQERAILAEKIRNLNKGMNLERLIMQTKDISLATIQGHLNKRYGIEDPMIGQMFKQFQTMVVKHGGIPSAQAMDGFWTELLSVGGMALAMLMLLGKFMKTKVMPTPFRRVWVWALLAVLAGVVIGKYIVRIGDLKEKVAIVARERQKYIDATGVKTKTTDGNGGDGTGAAGSGLGSTEYNMQHNMGSGASTCATVGADGSFAPAKCPANNNASAFNVPGVTSRTLSSLDPSHFQSLGTLGKTAHEMSNTGTTTPSTTSGGNLEGIKNNNAAMRKHNDKLRKYLDKIRLKHPNGHKPHKGFAANYTASVAKFGKGLQGKAVTAETAKAFAAAAEQLKKGSKELDKLKQDKGEANVTAGKVPQINIPQGNGLDFSLPEFDAGKKSNVFGGLPGKDNRPLEDLGEFKMKHNDINKDKDVSLFKILSNRYILSYPKVIPEKKTKVPLRPKKKTEKGKLKDMLNK